MDFPAGLRENPFFRNMTDAQVNSVLSLAREKDFEGGETLVRQFDKNSDMMIVIRGKVAIKTFSGEVIAELMPGGVIGEVSLVDEAPRSASAIAIYHTTVAILESAKLHEVLDSDPSLKAVVMENVARILSARLRAANVQLDASGIRR